MGEINVNRKPDPRVKFEPDAAQDPRPRLAQLGSWIPEMAVAIDSVNPRCWMTRSARGLSWNRAGLAVSPDVHR
jgi:hypothetical protein